MTNIEKIRDALVSGINLAKSAGWTRHQKDEVAEAEEALRLFDEMTIQASVKSQLLSQDVEEFIAARYCMFSTTAEKFISETDLRAWMSGHVRVPVEPNDAMQAAGASAIRIETTALNKLWTANAVFLAMINASKGE